MRNKKGQFIKGNQVNKGRHHSIETKRRISQSKKENPTRHWLGKPKSEEVKKKISLALKGKTCNTGKTHFKKGQVAWNKGLKGLNAGEKNGFWKGGVTPIHTKIRMSLEYKLWRQAVFQRDNYTCIWCGQKGGNLEADHIKPFALFPELRFAIDNGRTLCKACHRQTDTWGRKMFNYKEEVLSA